MDPKAINFSAMPQTALNVVTKPADFFRGMPKTGGFWEPFVFAVVMGLVSGIIRAVFSLIGLGPGGAGPGGMMAGLSAIIIMPIAVAIVSFIGAAILFVIWKLMGSQENYEVAYRSGAYLMALSPITAIISVVPYAGGVLSMALYVLYLVMASVYVHQIPSKKAWLVFGIIGIILALLTIRMEYKTRQMASEVGKWRKMGDDMRKEYKQSADEMKKSSEEMRKQAERMAEKFKEQAEAAKKQAEQNQ